MKFNPLNFTIRTLAGLPATLSEMRDNPDQIASHPIEQHGVDGALKTAREGIAAAHASGDNYGPSVWWEVRRALRDAQNAAQVPAGS